jgi:hypothetical protein
MSMVGKLHLTYTSARSGGHRISHGMADFVPKKDLLNNKLSGHQVSPDEVAKITYVIQFVEVQ